MRFLSAACTVAAISLMSLIPVRSHADEGMWLLSAPPLTHLKTRHQFEPSADWLKHLQMSAVRLGSGGSGSFVSPDGLLITNHHVASSTLSKLSSEKRDLQRDGFHARTKEEEIRCLDLELNVLVSMEDVTQRINSTVTASMSPAEAFAARQAAKAKIEGESLTQTGLRSDVVTLYQGGEYHLYRYKRYTDVRLVFAPERKVGAFGGDPDNFEFPRYCLDITFFRAYENGQPAKIEHWLKLQPAGTAEGDLVIVAGHPGRTNRLLTLSEFEFARDVLVPHSAAALKAWEVTYASWSARSPENRRRAEDVLIGTQNGRKVFDGLSAALLDPAQVDRKREEESSLRSFAKGRPELADALPAWDRIAEAQKILAQQHRRNEVLENRPVNSKLFSIARTILRAVEERPKLSGERLREYRDSNRASLELSLFSEEPIYTDLEIVKATHSLTRMIQELGYADEVSQLLRGERESGLYPGKAGKVQPGEATPGSLAARLVNGSALADVAFRKKLYAMTPAELAKVSDPMLELARALDPAARKVRKVVEEQDEVKQQAHAAIARVRYARDGASVYPDATFTLRLSFGLVKGYPEAGATIPAFTTLGGIFQRSTLLQARPPFDLPTRWTDAKQKIAGGVPFNFVSTNDIIGGNSGSPVVNRAGEFVGIIFDGNLASLGWGYAYSDAQARAISVDVRAILETLQSVYQAKELLAELLPSHGG